MVTEKSDEIPYGCFVLVETNSGPILRLMDISADGYIDLGRKEYQGVYEDFIQFRKNRDKYASATPPRRHRSSMLMFGPPGNGKTREITRVLSSAKDDKFRAIFIGSEVRLSSLNAFKKALAGEDIVFVIEEITERTGKREDVDQLLSFTDGELSWDHCYIIATTNYANELPWNIIDRPGRFKTVTEVPAPKLKERIAFLKGSGLPIEEAQDLAEVTSGLSIDYLSALMFDHYVTGRPFKELLAEMHSARNKVRCRFKRIAGMSEGAEPAMADRDADEGPAHS
jgi:SpoVK/Ycf46/Vps4 family AAA+-type ATPase